MTDWQAIKEQYEQGISQRSLALKHGISQAAISKKANKEKWVITPVIIPQSMISSDNSPVDLSEVSSIEIVEKALKDLALHLEDAPLDLKSHKLFADALSQYIKLKLLLPESDQDYAAYDLRALLAEMTAEELAIVNPIIKAVATRKAEQDDKIRPLKKLG